MKKHMLLIAGLVAGLVLAGCTTPPKPMSESKQGVDFAKYKSFTVLPLAQNVQGMDPGAVLRLGSTIVGSATASMTSKGYAETKDKAAADLALVIKGKSVPKTDITDWGFSYGMGWGRYPYGGAYMGSNVTVDQYEEGTLVIEVYDTKTKEMVWVGWITGRVSDKKEGQAERAANAVTQVLASYPVAAK